MKRNLLLLLVCSCFAFYGKAQQKITLSNGQVFQSGSGRFFDSGGEFTQMPNEYLQATIKAPVGYIEAFFTKFDLPSGSELRIYRGDDTTQLIGAFNGTIKPARLIGKSITFVYDPKNSVGQYVDFEGEFQTITNFEQFDLEKVTLPESDCIGAIPLCGNNTVNTSANQYDNTGNVNDDNGGCYSGTGNGGSVWYSFSPQTNGNLDFMITPTGSTDYDFVLWDITNGCNNKTQISCNYSGTTGATGLNSSGTLNSQDASGTTNNQLENVQTTHVYALCINYYSGNNDGFTLNFHNIPSTVNIVDNIPPTIENAYTSNCANASQFTIEFSEYIDCNTLQSTDFVLPGHTVTLVTTNCSGGKTISVEVSVSPALPPGNYNMTVSNMSDMCGNPLNQVFPINTLVVPVANAGPDQVACSSPGLFGTTNYGSVTLTGSGGTSYTWSTGENTASISVSPHGTTTYTLTAISGSCSATDQVTVTVSASPTPNLGPDQTVCAGFPITLNASGGGSYQWQSTTSTNWFGNPTGWTNIPGATNPSYTGNPSGTIYYQVIVTNAAGCQGKDYIKVTIGSGTFGVTAPPFVCQGSPMTLTLPASMTAYTWEIAGTPVGTPNTPYTTTPSATTTYTAVSTTPGCTGSASVTVPVHPLGTLTTAVNPTNACPGVPVNLTSNAPSNSSNSSTENFESANSFTLVNGSKNKWYWGGAAFANGTKSLYIGTASNNNNYEIGGSLFPAPITATNFAYKDYTIVGYCSPSISFNWRCNGQSAKAELSVWAVPTSFTPVAGTQITAGGGNVLIGGPYFGTTTYSNVSLDLSAYSGSTVRIVFQWYNAGNAILGAPTVANPAASIDDIVLTDNTTYSIAWTGSNGFSASTANATDNPTAATNYNLTVTRCDGCPMTSSVAVTDCSPLPVELVSFSGENNKIANELYWVTENEVNVDYFILERSTDVVNWKVVSYIEPSDVYGIQKKYNVSDFGFQPNAINYYRLISVDNDASRRENPTWVSLDNRSQTKKVIYRTNLLGQRIADTQKGLVIFVYDDGTTERVFLAE